MAWFNDNRKPTEFLEIESLNWEPFKPPLNEIQCFLCGDKIDWYKGVYWNGSPPIYREDRDRFSGYIFLHPDCAKRLALHLAKDALLADKKDIITRAKS